MLFFVLVALAAAPEAGSTFAWSFEDVRSAKLESGLPGSRVEVAAHLGKAELQLSVVEPGADAPRRFTVKVIRGPSPLLGRSFEVESNYGEALLSEPPSVTKSDLPAAIVRAQREQEKVLQKVMSTLLTADPIVAATTGGDRCGEATREKVAQAAGKVVARLTGDHPDEISITRATAACVGTSGKYSVAFTLSSAVQDQVLEFPWKGTVEVPAGAWRASFKLSLNAVVEFKTNKKAIRIRSQSSLQSSWKKK